MKTENDVTFKRIPVKMTKKELEQLLKLDYFNQLLYQFGIVFRQVKEKESK